MLRRTPGNAVRLKTRSRGASVSTSAASTPGSSLRALFRAGSRRLQLLDRQPQKPDVRANRGGAAERHGTLELDAATQYASAERVGLSVCLPETAASKRAKPTCQGRCRKAGQGR